jgi:hypothetical protein
MRRVFDPFTFGPAVAGLAMNIFAVDRAVRGEQSGQPAADAPVTRDSITVHLPFQEDAVAVLDRLGYLCNFRMPPMRFPPVMLGTVWSLPILFRTLRHLPDQVQRLQQDYVTAATVGPASLIDPMAAVFTEIGEACMSFAPRGHPRKNAFDEHCSQAYDRLAEYRLLVRERLAGALG